MRPLIWSSLLLVCMVGCMPVGAEIGGQPAIGPDMVPEPGYSASVGDRSVLYAVADGSPLDRLPLLKDVTAYDIYVRSIEARDNDRLFDLERQGWLHWAAPGTRVIVLDIKDRNHTGARAATRVQLDDQAGQTFWTASDYLTRLIRKAPE
jgi:hypothetical protein